MSSATAGRTLRSVEGLRGPGPGGRPVGRDVRRERGVHRGREPLPPAGRRRDGPRRRAGADPARAAREPCRIAVDAPGVTLANFGGFGYVGIQDTADRFTCEDVYITHAIDGAYVPFGQKGGCTAAFMVWGRKGRTVRDLVFRRCSRRAVLPPRLLPEPRGRERGRRFRGRPLRPVPRDRGRLRHGAVVLRVRHPRRRRHRAHDGPGLPGGRLLAGRLPPGRQLGRPPAEGRRTSSSSGAGRRPAAGARARGRRSSTSPGSTSSRPGSSTARRALPQGRLPLQEPGGRRARPRELSGHGLGLRPRHRVRRERGEGEGLCFRWSDPPGAPDGRERCRGRDRDPELRRRRAGPCCSGSPSGWSSSTRQGMWRI